MVELTLFQKIILREVPAEILYEDTDVISFKDINPQAPFHALVCPKEPIKMLSEASSEHQNVLGNLLLIGSQVAKRAGFENSFRAVINNGDSAGQTVFHLHLHILAGRSFIWPPG